MALIDSHVLIVGSWNALGTSVFYNAEFTTVLFDEVDSPSKAFAPVEQFVEESIGCGRLVRLVESPEDWQAPQANESWLLDAASSLSNLQLEHE